MFERNRRSTRADQGSVAVSDRETTERRGRFTRDGDDAAAVRDRDVIRRDEPGVSPATAAGVRARQRDEFGGFSWGSAFFGFLTAAGLAGLLSGLLTGAGAAIGLTEVQDQAQSTSPETISLIGGIVLLAILGLAYFCGGYVAGRMARFDGARQGVAVWLWGIIVAVAVAVLAAVAGSEYNVLDKLNLPRIPIDQGTLTTGGLIALALGVLVTLGGAILGGKTGERFHRKVDRLAIRDH